MSTSTKLFQITTTDAYQIKMLAELLSNTLDELNIVLTPTTITIRESNSEEKCILDVTIRVADVQYDPPQCQTIIGMNASHLYKMLKRCKKKDKLSLYIDKDEPGSFKCRILNAEKERNKEASLRIKDVPISSWQLPEYSCSPVTTVLTAEYLRMIKLMLPISPRIRIRIQPRGVKFSAVLNNMSSISDMYGDYDEDADDIYDRKFDTRTLLRLSKVTGIASSFKIFHLEDEAIIKFTANIGSIGMFSALLLPNNEEEEEIVIEELPAIKFNKIA